MEYSITDLNFSKVDFDEEQHTYTSPEGKRLSGVTTMLKRYVFPDMHKNIPSRILNAAAAKGKEIHSQVEMIVDGFGYDKPSKSVVDFFQWADEQHIKFIASEFLVDLYPMPFTHPDEETGVVYDGYASAIDIIDSNMNLYDIKTTRDFNREYVSWQLSIYAYMLEMNNPKIKANGLYGVWLKNGKAHVIKVDRIDKAIIQDLLWAYAYNQPWTNPLVPLKTDNFMLASNKELAVLTEIENQIAFFENNLNRLKEQEKTMKEGLLKIMLANDKTHWVSPNGKLTFSVRHGSPRQTFDTAMFKQIYPELYGKFLKETKVSDSLIIKVNNNGTLEAK